MSWEPKIEKIYENGVLVSSTIQRTPNGPKEALAQPEQEPVATLDDLEQEIYENTRQFVSRDVMEWMLKRYYTTPPQRTWVGLTDVEWMNIVNKNQAWFGQRPDEVAHEVAKLVEVKLKEKNT